WPFFGIFLLYSVVFCSRHIDSRGEPQFIVVLMIEVYASTDSVKIGIKQYTALSHIAQRSIILCFFTPSASSKLVASGTCFSEYSVLPIGIHVGVGYYSIRYRRCGVVLLFKVIIIPHVAL